MSGSIEVPEEWVKAVGSFRFPAETDGRLQWLMDRNNEGRLSTEQQDELASLAELSEELSILRGEAAQYLGDSDS
ncbi:MAG: hypothetical protein KDN19_02880 [Verrucomicrobiae bacterium]|nr:hypothetical protein [Verrucomicrobiae bacterium]